MVPKMKIRIVQRTDPTGKITFEIQRNHWLFNWIWIDAWKGFGPSFNSSFPTYEMALENLWQFDGSKSKDIEIRVFE
jgi:hypothetical protein